ncbi:hypothetical protein AAFN47_15075 [Hoeflea sp. CAU 1731]
MPKIFDRNIDTVIFLIALLVIFALVKALTLLPSRYYFTFSQIVGPQNQTQFLASPELPSPAAFCRALHVKESESQIRETVSLTEREVGLLEPCGELNAMHNVQYQVFYTYDIVDGQHLNSDAYNAALDRLISYLKNNEAIIKGAMLQNGVVPENSLSNLTAIDIENILVQDNYLNISSIINYLAGNETPSSYSVYDTLRNATELGSLVDDVENQAAVDQQGLRSRPEWVKRAETFRKTQLASQHEEIQAAILAQDKYLFWPAVLLKMAPAFVGAFLIGLWRPERAIFDAPVAAGVVAFLFCWPIMVLWDVIVASEWKSLRPQFFALYLSYVLSYFFTARLGVTAAIWAKKSRVSEGVRANLDFGKIVATLLTTLITTSATALITWSFANAGQ